MKISVIIPVFNEEKYILDVLKSIRHYNKNLNIEVIVSDDGSTDNTTLILSQNDQLFDKLINNPINRGKGAAIKSALKYITGEIVIIQDADLEYSPNQYKKLIDPIINDNAQAVYGSRFIGGEKKRVIYFSNRVANFILTFLVNIITNINFTDVETGHKAIKKEAIDKIILNENSFTFEIELTLKLAKNKVRFYEVGINYNGRSYEEGKKIKLKDFFKALWAIIKYGFILNL
jgi:glycosyltransferase involved in cell wall biosynthesis